MKTLRFNFLLSALLTVLFWTDSAAQEFYRIQTNSSKLTVEGTSSVHDWEMEVTGFKAETILKLDGEAVAEISRIEFESPVSGLKSGKSIMDSKAREALNGKKFPEIKFMLEKSNAVNISGDKAVITGLLTIAGKTKEVKLSADIDVKTAQRFQVSGSIPLKMSEFGVDPPTALMGALKTNDDVKISFSLEFEQSDREFSHNY